MADKQKPPEEEGGEGAPLWIISFADMMSLLMAFFVMLSTFSGFGPNEAEKLKSATSAMLAPNYYGGWYRNPPRARMGHQMVAAGQIEKGSEKPTLEEAKGAAQLAETDAKDFKTRKVFLTESKKVFWGGGTALSADGRDFLNTLAAFVKSVQDRIIISESSPGDPATARSAVTSDSELGIFRAIVIVEYLGSKGIAKSRCSVAARGQLAKEKLKDERMLEVTLLEEGTYK